MTWMAAVGRSRGWAILRKPLFYRVERGLRRDIQDSIRRHRSRADRTFQIDGAQHFFFSRRREDPEIAFARADKHLPIGDQGRRPKVSLRFLGPDALPGSSIDAMNRASG